MVTLGQGVVDIDQAGSILSNRPEVLETEEVEGRIRVVLSSAARDISFIPEALVRGGAKLVELREDALDLEEVFLRVTKGESQ